MNIVFNFDGDKYKPKKGKVLIESSIFTGVTTLYSKHYDYNKLAEIKDDKADVFVDPRKFYLYFERVV